MTAEFHAVVENDGSYIDITPQVDGSRRILFLPLPETEIPSKPVPNRFKLLADHKLLNRFCELQARQVELQYEGKVGSTEFNRNDTEAVLCLETYLGRQQKKPRK